MIKVLITDLDDTLYDWISFYIPAFYGMAEKVSAITDIPFETIIKEYKHYNTVHKNTEAPWSTLFLPSVIKRFKGKSQQEIKVELDPAFHIFNSIRKKELKLFDGVYDALKTLHKKNVKIIAYTESFPQNAIFRLKKLGILGFFEEIICSDMIENVYNIENIKCKTISSRKPSPEILLKVCDDYSVSPDEAIYMGDSLAKDIYMAYLANMKSILYVGDAVNPDYIAKLYNITYWTRKDVEQNNQLKEKCVKLRIHPTFTLKNFNDLPDLIFKE